MSLMTMAVLRLAQRSDFEGVVVRDGRVSESFWAFLASWLLLRLRDDQESVASGVETQVARLFGLLDLGDLDSSQWDWLAAVVDVIESGYSDSASVMTGFINDYGALRAAQSGDITRWRHITTVSDYDAPEGISGLIVREPEMDLSVVAAQMLQSTVGTLRRGSDPGAALSNGVGAASQEALQGGRDVAREFAAQSGVLVGWQRITDSNPCAFCALLAAKGPVYQNVKRILATDKKFVLDADVKHDNDARVHYHCKCSIVPVYEDEPEPLSGWSRIAQELWEAGGLGGDDAKEQFRAFRRRYDRYKKTHPDEGVEVDERVLRRQMADALRDTSVSEERNLLRSLRRRMR